ncbi:histidinol phosphate phosphatase H [Aspergillus pseudocaelatus]|uniref:Histidinol-phosphatase n=1 Tax=Aspergillus pseudocaelatus TaxID=1825620 RepID=A0ABQ6WGQ0_9EURO|nr:histidinol phosphate phosphatase H [Aspergillus pseudocaelatus]
MPFSHHSHSGQFCGHAVDTLEDVLQAAIRKQLKVYSFTEHIPRDEADFYPEEIASSETRATLFKLFDDYYHEACRLRDKYKSQITVLIGFEIDWIRPSSRTIIAELLQSYSFDFFVGSIHHVHTHIIDGLASNYEKATIASGGSEELLYRDYYDAQFEMLVELKPTVVGHFDVITLRSKARSANLHTKKDIWERIVRNLRYIHEYGGALEINSASLRKQMNTPYPHPDICKEFLRIGGRFVLSDDSHGVSQVALDYPKVRRFLENTGIKTIYYVKPNGDAPPKGLSPCCLEPVEVAALRDHPSWA